MSKSESIKNIAEAMVKIQSEMPVVPFDKTNDYAGYRYATLGKVIDISNPVMAKYGVSICQMVISEDGNVGIETYLMHTSGEWISSKVTLAIEPEKGKSKAQVAGSYISYLRRYSLAAAIGIYTDEDNDGNKPEPTRKPTRAKPEAQANDDIMTIERASKVTNSEGTPYVDIASDVLQRMVIGINKGLQNSIDDEKRAEYLEKKQAIGVILKARADKSI